MKCPTCGTEVDQAKLRIPPDCVFEDIYRCRCASVGEFTPTECRIADGTETSDIDMMAISLPHDTTGFDRECVCSWEKIGTRMRVVNR